MKVNMKSFSVALIASTLTFGTVVAQDVASGLKALDAEQTCQAKDIFDKLAATPSAENSFYQGYYLLRTNKPDEAKAAFEKGLAADPKSNLNKVGLGAVALAKGDRNGKLMIDEAIKSSKGKDMDVLFRAGEAMTGYGRYENSKLTSLYKTTDPAAAIAYLDQAIALGLKNKKENADVYMAKGDALYARGEAGPAVSAYEDALRVNASSAKALTRIAKIYWGGKNLPLAQENFKKALEADVDYAPANREYAELLFYSRSYKPAARYFNAYIDKLGACASDDDILRSAKFDFIAEDNAKVLQKLNDNATLKNSNNPVLYRMQGWAAYRQNQYDLAIQKLNDFLKAAPEKAEENDYRFLGNSQLRVNPVDTVTAIGNLTKAAELDTVDNVYKEIAAFYQSARKYKESVDYWNKAIAREKTPTAADYFSAGQVTYNYANSFKPAGVDSVAMRQTKIATFMKADSLFAKVIEKKPEFTAAYRLRAGASYYAYPQTEALENGLAIPLYEKFIEVAEKEGLDKGSNKADVIRAYKILGSYQAYNKKDNDKAKTFFQKIISLDSSDVQAKAFLNPPVPVPVPAPAKAPAKAATKPAAAAPKKKKS
jgi:tetratricopeptide (TPR) repeat protein